jgi:hypothetical protein
VSIQDIRQNPQDTSNFYLANIYQTLADPNGSNISSSLPASPPPFSPPNYAVWVNALWFLSLVISLTCALLATLLQQWARRYLKITQPRYSLHKRARIRAFFSEGVEKCLLPWAVETLPTLLHISLFLFFASLIVFLSNVNLTIFKLVLSWVGLCVALYGCITCMPIIRHDSPYYTPLSSFPLWHIVTGTLFCISRLLRWFNKSVRFRFSAYLHFLDLEERRRKSLVWGRQKTAEKTALKSPSEIDARAFMWTFDCLDEDHELERFFSGLPGFRSSKVVHDPLPSLTKEEKWKFYWSLDGFLGRTFSSDLLPAPVKNRRAMICAKAVDPEHLTHAFGILNSILIEYQFSGPLATVIANILRSWGNNVGELNILYAQVTIPRIIVTCQPHDESWYALTSHELGFPEAVLRDYAAHGDSLSLLILIHVVRQQFIHFRKPSWPRETFSSVLAATSNFNVKDTSPELQHEFCTLWNQIVRESQTNNSQRMAFLILGRIRNVFLSLHQGTDPAPTQISVSTDDSDGAMNDPTSYPVCNVPGRHSESKPLIDDGSTSVVSVRAVPHDCDKTTPVTTSFLAHSLDPTSAPIHAALRVQESLTNAPPFGENVSISIQAQTTIELHSSSPPQLTTGATHEGLDTSKSMTHLFTPEPTAYAVPPGSNASTSPPDPIIELTAVAHTPSRDVEVPSSHSPTPGLDNFLAIGMLFPLDAAVTESEHTPFSPESHSPMLAPAAGGTSRSWDQSAAVEQEEGAKAASSQETRKAEPHDDVTVTPDVPTRLLPPQPIVGPTIAGLSRSSSRNSRDSGEYPSHPHGQHDIV